MAYCAALGLALGPRASMLDQLARKATAETLMATVLNVAAACSSPPGWR